jgi:selenocysteine lyase/cysteine desulfurase
MGPGEGRLDVARVRGLFPGLSDGLVHAEGSAGALLPENVVLAVAQAMRVPVADRGGVFPASARAEGLVASARTAVADLVGGVSTGVVLGPDPSRLTWTVARALART